MMIIPNRSWCPLGMLCFAILIAASPCTAQTPEVPSPDSGQSGDKAPQQLTIKGFYIGMSRQAAEAALLKNKNAFSNAQQMNIHIRRVEIPGPGGQGTISDFQSYDIPGEDTFRKYFGFSFDAQNRLVSMTLDPMTVAPLFNVSDMQPQDFAQSIADHYSIPTLDEVDQPDGTYFWKYSSSYGWEIRIGSDKSLVLVAIPKPEQRQFN